VEVLVLGEIMLEIPVVLVEVVMVVIAVLAGQEIRHHHHLHKVFLEEMPLLPVLQKDMVLVVVEVLAALVEMVKSPQQQISVVQEVLVFNFQEHLEILFLLLELQVLLEIIGLVVEVLVEYTQQTLDQDRQKVELDHNQHQVQLDHMLVVEMVV
jgi:hypothetical protein